MCYWGLSGFTIVESQSEAKPVYMCVFVFGEMTLRLSDDRRETNVASVCSKGYIGLSRRMVGVFWGYK